MCKHEVSEIELNPKFIGERIRIARETIHITQKTLAERCGCTATHVSNLEKGKIGVSLELLYRISVLTQQPLDFFVMDEPTANIQKRINLEIAPLLEQCDQNTLRLVTDLIRCCIEHKVRTGE